ncbi:hypothetical protein L596_022246 [Steinernema carpocapsae]|uniref:C2H2-type domain-containing protein n=1 Tax=Steinernema carpocapsae TaxID=34508 RepID=A0A4U5ML80_STECR|nr:hypothetical protein L596_022246 [Steinernema carpocapsae]
MATMSEEATMSDPEEDEYVAVRIEGRKWAILHGRQGRHHAGSRETDRSCPTSELEMSVLRNFQTCPCLAGPFFETPWRVSPPLDVYAEWKPNVELQVGEDGLHTLVAVDENRNTTILAKQAEETRKMEAFEKQNKPAEEPQADEDPQTQPQTHPKIKQQPEESPIAKEQLHMKPLDPAHISHSPLPMADFQNEKPFTLSMANGSQEGTIILQEPVKTGKKNRVYGGCVCPQCGQTFVNVARLERHLSVHEVHGSFLCPLCGKTYKYEYNLFYHWRRNCRDMNELVPQEERRYMDVHQLRDLVDEVAKKKEEIGPIDMGFARRELYYDEERRRITPTPSSSGTSGEICPHCSIYVVTPSHAASPGSSSRTCPSRPPRSRRLLLRSLRIAFQNAGEPLQALAHQLPGSSDPAPT